MQVAEDEDRETEDDLDEEDEEYDSGGSGVAMTPPGACSNLQTFQVIVLSTLRTFLHTVCNTHQCFWNFRKQLKLCFIQTARVLEGAI